MSILSEIEFFQLFPRNPTTLPAASVADLKPTESPNIHWPSEDSDPLASGWLNFGDSENFNERQRPSPGSSTLPVPSDDQDTIWIKDLINVGEDDDHQYVLLLINFLHCKFLWKSPSTSSGASQSSQKSPAGGQWPWEVEKNYIRRRIGGKLCYRCKLCSDRGVEKITQRKGDLRRHLMSYAHSPKSFICPSCSHSYTRPDALKRHPCRAKATKALPEATGT